MKKILNTIIALSLFLVPTAVMAQAPPPPPPPVPLSDGLWGLFVAGALYGVRALYKNKKKN